MFEAAMSRSSENVSRASRVQDFINVVDRDLYGGVSGKLRKLNSLIGFFHHTQHTMKKIPVHFRKSHLVVAVYFLYSLFSHSNCTHQPAGMISEADTDYAGAGFEAKYKYISGRGLLEEKMPT